MPTATTWIHAFRYLSAFPKQFWMIRLCNKNSHICTILSNLFMGRLFKILSAYKRKIFRLNFIRNRIGRFYVNCRKLKCCDNLTHILQLFHKRFILFGCKHVVSCLHLQQGFCRNIQSCLDKQCKFCIYLSFAIQHLIKQCVWNPHFCCQLFLRDSSVFQFTFQHFPGMCRSERLKVVCYLLYVGGATNCQFVYLQ